MRNNKLNLKREKVVGFNKLNKTHYRGSLFISSNSFSPFLTVLITLITILFFGNSIGQTTTFTSAQNPIFRDAFTADPSPMVHNGRLYVYVGQDEAKDGELFTMTGWRCYSTTDMKNWTSHGVIMTPTDFSWGARDAWAAQVVERNGKFYLYVTVTGNNPYGGRNVGVAVSDSPTGPFIDARGTPLIRDNMTNNGKVWDDIDPTVFIDDDGQAYMSWGNPICYLVKLKANMTEIDGSISQITPPNYAEGPWLSKRKDLYYLTYPAFVAPVGSEQICYSTANNINGPWTYRGILTGAARNSYTIHPGIVEYKGQSYLFYHNATLTLNGQGPATGRRSVCVEYLCYNSDGTIKPITQTTAGITVASPCPPALVPTITLLTPANNSTYIQGETIPLSANAAIMEGTIASVKFYDGTTLLSTDDTSPYTYSWTTAAVGTHQLKAVATDNTGKTAEATITIQVNVPQGPYEGTVHPIPGTIQFEHYDVGGNGFAYLDDSPENTGGAAFRMDEAVDLENCTDSGTGYNIGFATSGEWLEYSVIVAKPGTYEMNLRVACNGDARTLTVAMDGVNIATEVAIPNTGGWQTWQTVKVNNINLKPGEQVMRVAIGAADYINLNYVTFMLVKELKQEPFNGMAHIIPGRIEAEEYDLGGEGVAYHEANSNGNEANGTFRNDAVDIEMCTDTKGGFNLGYTLTNEWVEYTVNVANTSNYELSLRLAKNGNGGLFHIEMDEVDITGPIEVPNTGGWQVWETITLNDISLTAGEHIMKIVFDTDYTNLNYLTFSDLVTATSSFSANNIEIFPNPSKNKFNITPNSIEGYKIFDLNGHLILSDTRYDNASFGSNLEQGVYILEVNNRGIKKHFKIVKE